MALFLMQERALGEDSFFAPYIAALPSSIPQAAYFPKQVLEKSEDAVLVRRASDRMHEVRSA